MKEDATMTEAYARELVVARCEQLMDAIDRYKTGFDQPPCVGDALSRMYCKLDDFMHDFHGDDRVALERQLGGEPQTPRGNKEAAGARHGRLAIVQMLNGDGERPVAPRKDEGSQTSNPV